MRKISKTLCQNQEVFIGLEDSKRSFKLCVRSQKMVIHETSMPAEFKVLLAYLESHFDQCQITIIYEAGFKGFTLHDKLVAHGIKCVVTPAHMVTQEKHTRVKCDKIDARRLAINLENNDYHLCHVPDKERREDRQISRLLGQVQRDITRYKNRIRKFLDLHGYDEVFPAGKWSDRDYARLDNLTLSPPLACTLDVYRQMLKTLQATKKALLVELKILSKKARYAKIFELFQSAPGIGAQTAIRLVLEWGEDLSRFKTGKQFASYTGLTSSEHSTGETIRRGRITGQSNPQVRSWLVENAWVSYKRDPVLLKKFQSVYSRTNSKKKAIVAVARKLAVRLYTLARTGESYELGLVR